MWLDLQSPIRFQSSVLNTVQLQAGVKPYFLLGVGGWEGLTLKLCIIYV